MDEAILCSDFWVHFCKKAWVVEWALNRDGLLGDRMRNISWWEWEGLIMWRFGQIKDTCRSLLCLVLPLWSVFFAGGVMFLQQNSAPESSWIGSIFSGLYTLMGPILKMIRVLTSPKICPSSNPWQIVFYFGERRNVF